MSSKTLFAMICGLALVGTETAIAQDSGGWDISGDLRVMFYSENWRDTRSGATDDAASSGARFRLRLRRELGENWRLQTRFAATAADQGNDWDAYLRSWRESGTAVDPGTATLDEFFLQYTSPDDATQVRIGRMQSTLTLPLITSKSLDRNQASNINIGWTDGISLRREFGNDWYAEVIAEYHSQKGNGFTTRGPLTFDDSGSRVGLFGVLGSDAEVGPIFMRAITLTVMPDSLATRGFNANERDDYITATGKLAAGWDLDEAGRRLVVAGEAGYAFNQPQNAVLGLPGDGDVGGLAWEIGADLVEVFPNHSIGVIYGQTDAGWLISNDYRQNNELAEFRWQWKVTDPLRLEFRARWRRDLERAAGAPFLQRDRDVRLRATWKF